MSLNPRWYIVIYLSFTIAIFMVSKLASKHANLESMSFENEFFALNGIVFILTILGSCSWILVLKNFELSYAFPFHGLLFVGVMLMSNLLFGESIDISKIFGSLIIVAGVVLVHYSND